MAGHGAFPSETYAASDDTPMTSCPAVPMAPSTRLTWACGRRTFSRWLCP